MGAYNAHVRSASAGVSHSVRPIRASLPPEQQTTHTHALQMHHERLPLHTLPTDRPRPSLPPAQGLLYSYVRRGPRTRQTTPKTRRPASLWSRYGSGKGQLVVFTCPHLIPISGRRLQCPSPGGPQRYRRVRVVGGTWSGRQITTAYWSVPSVDGWMSTASISYVHTRGCEQFPWSHRSGGKPTKLERKDMPTGYVRGSLIFFETPIQSAGWLSSPLPSPPPSSLFSNARMYVEPPPGQV